jgi:hypothetical protein
MIALDVQGVKYPNRHSIDQAEVCFFKGRRSFKERLNVIGANDIQGKLSPFAFL